MKQDFDYDFSELSMQVLQAMGIRSIREIIEVIEAGETVIFQFYFKELDENVIRFIGFTRKSQPIVLACVLNENLKLKVLAVRIPDVREIIEDFCKNCS